MIHILGAGSLGCLLAARLFSHHETSFITTRTETAPSITFNYLTHTDNKLSSTYHIPILAAGQLTHIDTLLVCTKSYDCLPALKCLKDHFTDQTKIVLFQNGLGSQNKVIEAFPELQIYAAVTTEGANKPDKNTLIHAGKGLTRIGALTHNHQQTKQLKSLVDIFLQTGLSVTLEDSISQALWHKLAINCAINPFTAILDCANGEITASDLFKENWPELRRELSTALALSGNPLDESKLEERVFKVIHGTARNISSMLQDVRAKRRTEINDINGYVSDFLASHNQGNTINSMLCQRVNTLNEGA